MTTTGFTSSDEETWTILFDQQMAALNDRCRPEYLEAVDAIGLRRDRVPDACWLDERLASSTGWQVVEVAGSLRSSDFFEMTASRRFPISTTMRPRDELDHARLPDIFHDVFGHLPLLAIPALSEFLLGISAAALVHRDDAHALRRFSRAVAWTVEFGVMGELDDPKVYGAGLITSRTELHHALGPDPVRHRFEPARLLDTSHVSAALQDEYFVAGSFDELRESVHELARLA